MNEVDYPKLDKYPHCDSLVLHSPESGCVYCNLYSNLQEFRIKNNINFTGETDPNKTACPSTVKRPLNTINRWSGNQICTATIVARTEIFYQVLREELNKIPENDPNYYDKISKAYDTAYKVLELKFPEASISNPSRLVDWENLGND